MSANKMQEQKMLDAGIKAMVEDGKDGNVLRTKAQSNPETRQLLIDIGILVTKSYDSEWLESQRGWLETYQRSLWEYTN